MANNPTGQNSFGLRNDAVYEMGEHSSTMEGASLVGFDSKDAADKKERHRVVIPHNMSVPGGTQWNHGTLAAGIISVAGKESKELVHAAHGSGMGASGGSNDSMIGLELGKRTYFEVLGGNGGGVAGQVSSQAPPKKPRIAGQTPKCQVKGCTADLSSAKDYHRKHKVCANHSKAAWVIVQGKEGKEQRFCQQCSRFHGLDDFDEGKRSCRKRLAGHNERRRKPQLDALGPNARFLPAFQDSSRLGHLFTERSSFLPRVRIPGMSPPWNDSSQHKGAWPSTRLFPYGDQSFECSMPASTGMERRLFSNGLCQPNDRSTLFSPPSPKDSIPVAADVTSPKTHQYFQVSVNPLGQSLSLTSPSGAGVLSGLEAITVGQDFARVSDSGCALSLQSTMQLLSSTQGSVAASLDTITPSNMITDHSLHSTSHIPIAQPLIQGGQQHHHFEWVQNKLPSAASSFYSLSSATADYRAGSSSIDKDHLEGPFTHGITGVDTYECVPFYSMLHGEVRLEEMPQDVKPTIDLMQVASSSNGQNTQPLVSSGSFDFGFSHFADLQAFRTYESSIFSTQHM